MSGSRVCPLDYVEYFIKVGKVNRILTGVSSSSDELFDVTALKNLKSETESG